MIHSMTGFATYADQNNEYITEVNIRTVNSRYMEINVKIPEKLKLYEMEIRNCFKDFFNRHLKLQVTDLKSTIILLPH